MREVLNHIKSLEELHSYWIFVYLFSFGNYGACFFPAVGPEPVEDEVVDVYAARPGLRLWRATSDGKVLSTMMFRDSINKGLPEIQTLDLASTLPAQHAEQKQFGSMKAFHDQFVVTWQGSNVWVLDPTTGVVVGCHSNLGCVVDVSVSDNEIFVLSKGKDHFVRRIVFEVNPCFVVEELDLNNPSDVIKAQSGSISQFENQERIDKLLDDVGSKMNRAFFDVKTRVKGITEQMRSREASEDDRGSESDRFSSPKSFYKKDANGDRCLATSEGYSTGNGVSTDENEYSDRPFESSNDSLSSPGKTADSSNSPLDNVEINETESIQLNGISTDNQPDQKVVVPDSQMNRDNSTTKGQQTLMDDQNAGNTMEVVLTHKKREKEPVFGHLSKEDFAKDIVFEGTSVASPKKKKKKKTKKGELKVFLICSPKIYLYFLNF